MGAAFNVLQDACAQSVMVRDIDSMLRVLPHLSLDSNRVKTLNELGLRYLLAGNHLMSARYADSAIALAALIHYDPGLGEGYTLLGSLERDKGNYPGALQFYELVLGIMNRTGDKKGAARTLIRQGIIYDAQGKYTEAMNLYNAAFRIAVVLGDKLTLASYYGNVSNVHVDQGNYTMALEYRLKCLQLHVELGDNENIGTSYHDLGRIYCSLGNYTEALKNLFIALKIRKEIGHKRTIAGTYHFIGIAYNELGNVTEALKNHRESLRLKQELKDKRGIANSFQAIGDVYSRQQEWKEALNNYLLALQIREEIGDREGMAISTVSAGDMLSRTAGEKKGLASLKEYRRALTYLNRGLALASLIGIRETVSRAYEFLSETYAGLNDYKKALEYNLLFIRLSDSLRNNETTRKLEQLRTKHEVQEAVALEKKQVEARLTEQKLVSDKQLSERKRKYDIMVAGIIILLLISVFSILLMRQQIRKKREVDRAEAAHKMAELELQSLRAQLNPHFMFNSLNAIQDLIVNENSEKSHVYLSRFSKLLRILLDNADQPFVSLKQEIEFLELYLSLENLRIPDLHFSIEKDPAINMEERMIPNMMLQPYIENAIWHGLSGKKGERRLQIRIRENEAATEFEVQDNGIGRRKAAELKQQFRHGHHSKGMQLLSKRFELLSHKYSSAIQTTVTDLEHDGEATGTLVRIAVPFALSGQARKSAYDKNHYSG